MSKQFSYKELDALPIDASAYFYAAGTALVVLSWIVSLAFSFCLHKF